MPAAWLNALNAAVAAGQIPNIPPSVVSATGDNIAYPAGTNSTGTDVCSATFGCYASDDILNAPAGVFATSFDDGPTDGSTLLYDFLEPKNISATHFMIGSNILANGALFQRAFNNLRGDIAVHTWSHRYMSSLNNTDVVSELGWTIQIIKNSTGGRIPRYWRPPYGDVDNRVRAIAKQIFGLECVIWNNDTNDWEIATGQTTLAQVNASLTTWLTGPKSPGLVILEHELDNNTSTGFIDAYPLIISQGWKIVSVARMLGNSVYLNSQDGQSPVAAANGILYKGGLPVTSTSSAAPPPPTTTGNATGNVGSNTQSRNGGSIQTTISKVASAVGAMFLAVVFYA
jgi:peptidoglycan/xylan/chitin deacetylase (PgdA/CDA1 family)